jgi:hypothetical protein
MTRTRAQTNTYIGAKTGCSVKWIFDPTWARATDVGKLASGSRAAERRSLYQRGLATHPSRRVWSIHP